MCGPDPGPEGKLTHVDEKGAARMVDVSGKNETLRKALARAVVRMAPSTLQAILSGKTPKGDVFSAARIAGIMAAKRTGDLIPLCHPIRLQSVEVSLEPAGPDRVEIVSKAVARDATGVEMEALCAAAVAALTLYDMVKALDRGITIESVALLEKSGGRSGDWKRKDE